ncbi:unnamed protein product [Psylliodes chrysocephalus]|uniref:Uncharacterized protein n=1 Tax=Psylliodes chrysocephalus TaxID=3402493 RepID=A0A9P0G8H4_9CUCU|nr:unnamed protein product [Psylliodes chrysocephala]
MQCRTFCHPENRCCPNHLGNGVFSDEALGLIRLQATPRSLSILECEALINLLTERVSALEKQSCMFDFNSQNMEDEDYKCLTGLNRAQFNTLAEHNDDIKSRKNLNKKNCIALFLVKLRVDLSQKVLEMMFGMKPKQQPRVSEIFQDVLVLLTNNFVPRHLGYGHITREDYAQLHSTTISNRLCRVPS